MNRSHATLAALGVITVAATYLSWLQLGVAREATLEEARLTRVHARLEPEVVAAEKLNAITLQRRNDAQEKLDNLKTASPGAGNRTVAFKPLGVFQKERALDAKTQAMRLQQFKARLPLQYGLFYQTAGLSAQQIQDFEDLLAEHQQYQIDLFAASSAMDLSDVSPEIVALREADNERLSAHEKELLGDGLYKQLEEFRQTQPQRDVIARLNENLMFTSAPLSAEQASKLSALLTTSEALRKGAAAKPEADPDKLVSAAAQFLSAPQLTQLTLQLDQLEADRISEQLVQEMRAWAHATSSSGRD
jgi:hypothetical protein